MTTDAAEFVKWHTAGVITAREMHILHLRYVSGLTFSQIALALDISRSAAWSMSKRATQKIEIHERRAA